jgi:non-ribosomal peptide synthetase component F
MVTHEAIVRLVRESNYVDVGAEDVFLQYAPVSFDASTFEIWGCLLNGGRLELAASRPHSLEELGQVIEERGITVLWLTAGLFHQAVKAIGEKLGGVKQLLAGGDVLEVKAVRDVLKRCRERVDQQVRSDGIRRSPVAGKRKDRETFNPEADCHARVRIERRQNWRRWE